MITLAVIGYFVRILLILTALFITACSGALHQKNPSTYPYQFNQKLLTEKPVKKIIIANANFGRPTMAHLRKGEQRIKRYVKSHLEKNGYEILPNYYFDNAWKKAIRSYGQPYDPSTGRMDNTTWQRVMVSTGETLRQQTNADAIVFTDIIEHETTHNGGQQHMARFNGVSRKPSLKGSGSGGVPLDFDWNQPVKAATLAVNIYTINLERILMNYAGIEVTQSLDTKHSTPSFVRRKKLLQNESFIENAIEIGFHPFIPMEYYPGEDKPNQKIPSQ